jgi:GDPmannose 4,6-dehydratase
VVHGLIRRSCSYNTGRIDHIYQDPHSRLPRDNGKLILHYGDITDPVTLEAVLDKSRPHEVYNLAAQSHVRVSFDLPVYTADATAVGALKMLEAVRRMRDKAGQEVRYYQASSSEQFGRVAETPQSERTCFYPRSPYGISKVMAHWATVNYREAYDLHASCGILFNHESPRRGETFVTRKITRAIGRIKLGLIDKLYLGNVEAKRDWGFAGDYVKAMWQMLQQEKPDDYVIATGRSISVREFAEMAFSMAGLKHEEHVEIDARYFRPSEVDHLRGDASKAAAALGWKPTTSIERLCHMMVEADTELARREKVLRDAGHRVPGLTSQD